MNNSISKILIKNKWFSVSVSSVIIGFLSAVSPLYTMFCLFGLFFTFIFFKDIELTFLYLILYLLLQSTLTFNMEMLGISAVFVSIIRRADEFIWLILAVIILLYRFKGDEWKVESIGLEMPALVFCLIGISSALINRVSIFWSVISIFITLKGILIYWIGKNLNYKEEDIVLYYKSFLNLLLIIFLIGLMQYVGLDIPFLPQRSRLGVKVASSILGHHGLFGYIMAVGFSLSVGLFFGMRKKKWLIYSIIFFSGIVISSLRRSLIGIIFGVLFIFFNYRKLKINRKYIYVGLIAVVVFFGIFYNRFTKIFESTKAEYGDVSSANARYLLYSGAYKIFQNKPFWGEGPGRYGSYISIVTKSPVYRKYGINLTKFLTDTYWPCILGEYGIFGLIIILLMLLIIFRHLWNLLQRTYISPFLKGLAIGYNIMFVQYFVEATASQVYNDSLPAFILFSGIGILEKLIEKKSSYMEI
jgi:hypothetical protein